MVDLKLMLIKGEEYGIYVISLRHTTNNAARDFMT